MWYYFFSTANEWRMMQHTINTPIPFGGNGLGSFVYLRTYSRWNDEELCRETWDETVKRVVDYSIALEKRPNKDNSVEAQLMYESMRNLRVFPAGRTLWIGGTDAANKYGSANFNCAFVVIDSLSAFSDTFHLLNQK